MGAFNIYPIALFVPIDLQLISLVVNPLDTILSFWTWPIYSFGYIITTILIPVAYLFGLINYKNEGWNSYNYMLDYFAGFTIWSIIYPIA